MGTAIPLASLTARLETEKDPCSPLAPCYAPAVAVSPTAREARSPWLVWVLVPISCHLYGYFWWYTAGCELRDYLETDELQPERELLLALVTCGVYALFVLPFRYGRFIQRAQQKAGLVDAKNRGLQFFGALFLFYAGYGWMQHELNRAWRSLERSDSAV